MKYVALIHALAHPGTDPDSLSPNANEEREAATRRYEAYLGQLEAAGELIGGRALGDPAAATIYRWDGRSATQGCGPYAETTEHLAGFFLLDIRSPDRLAEIGAGLASVGQVVEIRAVADCGIEPCAMT